MSADTRLLTLHVRERRIDAAVAAPFRQAVMTEIQRHEANSLALDMAQVEFVDSSGLGALVSILKALGTAASMQLINVQPAVQTMLRLTRMDQIFRIQPAQPAAGS